MGTWASFEEGGVRQMTGGRGQAFRHEFCKERTQDVSKSEASEPRMHIFRKGKTGSIPCGK